MIIYSGEFCDYYLKKKLKCNKIDLMDKMFKWNEIISFAISIHVFRRWPTKNEHQSKSNLKSTIEI